MVVAFVCACVPAVLKHVCGDQRLTDSIFLSHSSPSCSMNQGFSLEQRANLNSIPDFMASSLPSEPFLQSLKLFQ